MREFGRIFGNFPAGLEKYFFPVLSEAVNMGVLGDLGGEKTLETV